MFAELFKAIGVPVTPIGSEAHWQNGLVEVSGRVWQRGFEMLCDKHDFRVGEEHRILLGCIGLNRSHNTRARHAGFSPLQWVLGRNLTLPTSLCENASNLAAQETIEFGEPQFQRRLQLLADCDESWIRADNDSKVRRTILGRMRPVRGPFVSGAQIYIHRKQGALGKSPGRCWVGPAVVICPDGDNLWCSLGSHLIKTAKELCRHASEEELMSCQLVASEISLCSKKMQQGQEKQHFIDLTGEDGDELPDDVRGLHEAPTAGEQENHGPNLDGVLDSIQEEDTQKHDRGVANDLLKGINVVENDLMDEEQELPVSFPTVNDPYAVPRALESGVGPNPPRSETPLLPPTGPPLPVGVGSQRGGPGGSALRGPSRGNGGERGEPRRISFTPAVGEKRKASEVDDNLVGAQPNGNKSRQEIPVENKDKEVFLSNRTEFGRGSETQELELENFLSERFHFSPAKRHGRQCYLARHGGMEAKCFVGEKKGKHKKGRT